QAFWLRISNPTSKPSDASPVKIEAPKELFKVSLVNESLKKLKFYLARFDNVVKIRTTPDAHTEDLLNEIMEVQTAFDQIDAAVQQSSVDKQCLEIAKKELLLENDRLLEQIMSQDVLLTMMNYMSLNGESMNIERKRNESCDKCSNLEAELLKSQNAHNDLLKSYSQLEKHSQLQDKDTTICKLKDIIKSMREKSKEENVNYDSCKLETKKVFKEKFDSIKKTRVRTKEQNDSLIDKLNLKSAENEDLKAQIQDKEQTDILRGIFEQAIAKQPSDDALDFALKKRLLSHPKTLSRKLGLKCSTSNCESKPTSNKKNDRISRTPSRNIKNKAEAQPRKVNKMNRVVKPIRDVDVKYLLLNANSKPICATCKKSMFDGVYGITFTIVGNSCPLTRITSPNVVSPKKTTSYSVETQKPELKVYNKKPKNVENVGSNKKAKIVESKNANHSEPNHTWGSNATDIPSSYSLVMTVRFGNDHIARILGYGDYQLGHNLFSVGQFCDVDLEVAFRKNTCFIRNLQGVDQISGSCDINLYTISLDDMLKTSMICLLSKASKTKSWLWHRRLSYLNFGTLNKLAKDGLARGIPRLKFQKDHLCSACALGKIMEPNLSIRHFVNFMKILASRIKHLLPVILSKTALSKGKTELL
ncbi:retrovirus-related pol polyprotein from transposon TNT 1-94, partial [Tanacetum coccineum]